MTNQPSFSIRDDLFEIVLNHVSLIREDRCILDSVSASFQSGQNWVIRGRTGAGKSMLANLLSGRLRPSTGTIVRNGFKRPHGIEHMSFTDRSTIFSGPNADHYYQQRFNAWDSDGHLTVRQYLQHANDHQVEIDQEIIGALSLEEFMDTERIKLSSGQHRRLFIARAMLRKPQLLILDNLYVGLDEKTCLVLNDFLDEWIKENGLTVIILTHNSRLPDAVCHELELEEGSLSYRGMVRPVKPIEPYCPEHDLDDLKSAFAENATTDQFQTIVQFQKARISYSGKLLLDDFTWSVKRGEKWLLSGDNGSGKSLICSMIYGDNPQAFANRIILFDTLLGQGISIWDIKRHIGYTSSELHVYFRERMRFNDVIKTGIMDQLYLGQLNVAMPLLGQLLIRFFKMDHLADCYFDNLSTGEQRLCLFIRALVKNPALLLFDEPFQAMDAVLIKQARWLLTNCLTIHHTMIFITHDMTNVPEIVVMKKIVGRRS